MYKKETSINLRGIAALITAIASLVGAFTLFHSAPSPQLVVGGPTSAANVLKITGGAVQTAQRSGSDIPGGSATFAPLSVVLTDPAGKPIAGARVVFVCSGGSPAMACQLMPAGDKRVSIDTGADGKAVLNQMGGNAASAYYASGPMPIVASADNSNSVTFNLTVKDAPPPPAPLANALMSLVGGDNQTKPRIASADGVARAEFAPLSINVKDHSGKPLSGVQIIWFCNKSNAMVCQSEPSGASPTTTITDGNGNSILDKMGGKSMSAYYADGAAEITASYGAAHVLFKLTVGGPALAATRRDPL